MELSNPKLIDALLSDLLPGHKPATPPPYQQPTSRRRHCQCGVCAWCADNTRWNRIFAEKFADPTYYLDRAVRHESPLR